MAQLSIRRLFAARETLTVDDLDAICDDLEAFFNQIKLSDDNIQDAGITASSKVAAGTITAAIFPNDVISTAKIADGAFTAEKITDSSITTAKLASNAVTTVKIADGAVTLAKREAVNWVTDTAAGSTVSSTSYNAIGLTQDITTTGRPVFIGITSAGVTTPSGCAYANDSGNIFSIRVRIVRNGTAISTTEYLSSIAGQTYYPITAVRFIDTPSAGTYNYAVQMSKGDASYETFEIYNLKLIVMEL